MGCHPEEILPRAPKMLGLALCVYVCGGDVWACVCGHQKASEHLSNNKSYAKTIRMEKIISKRCLATCRLSSTGAKVACVCVCICACVCLNAIPLRWN